MNETERTNGTEWAFVALGSNVGDRQAALAFARARLAELPGTELVATSEVQETEPLGATVQGPFLNQMVLLRTSLPPHRLLQLCQQIEQKAGRVRRERWGPRTLDLDIVRYGERRIDTPDLRIPHPELPNRPFWLDELVELAPHAV